MSIVSGVVAFTSSFTSVIATKQYEKVKEAKQRFLQEKCNIAFERQEAHLNELKHKVVDIDKSGSYEILTKDNRKIESKRWLVVDGKNVLDWKKWDEKGNCVRDNDKFYTYYPDSNKVEFSFIMDDNGKKEIKHFNQNGKEDTKQYISKNWVKYRIAQKHIREEKIAGKRLPVMTKAEKFKESVKQYTGFNR